MVGSSPPPPPHTATSLPVVGAFVLSSSLHILNPLVLAQLSLLIPFSLDRCNFSLLPTSSIRSRPISRITEWLRTYTWNNEARRDSHDINLCNHQSENRNQLSGIFLCTLCGCKNIFRCSGWFNLLSKKRVRDYSSTRLRGYIKTVSHKNKNFELKTKNSQFKIQDSKFEIQNLNFKFKI